MWYLKTYRVIGLIEKILFSSIHVINIVIVHIQYPCDINTTELIPDVENLNVDNVCIWGLLLVLQYCYCRYFGTVIFSQSTDNIFTSISNNIIFNNPTMILSGMCVIWSFSRSDNGTCMPYLNEFCWNVAPLWIAMVRGTGMEWFKYQVILIIIII